MLAGGWLAVRVLMHTRNSHPPLTSPPQVYEYWLHPLKFRSEMCRKGPLCDRRL